MSETVKKLGYLLEDKGYKLKDEVKIGILGTKDSKPREKTFKRNDEGGIKNFYVFNGPFTSIMFTTTDRIKLKYATEDVNMKRWILKEIRMGPIMMDVSAIEDVLELHI